MRLITRLAGLNDKQGRLDRGALKDEAAKLSAQEPDGHSWHSGHTRYPVVSVGSAGRVNER